MIPEKGQLVFISKEVNPVWTGKAVVVDPGISIATVRMLTGRMEDKEGGFLHNEIKLLKDRNTYAQGFKDAKRAIRKAINKQYKPGAKFAQELDRLFLNVQPKESQ